MPWKVRSFKRSALIGCGMSLARKYCLAQAMCEPMSEMDGVSLKERKPMSFRMCRMNWTA